MIIAFAGAVKMEEVCQENICCLNSALVVLLFACKEGRLEEVLQALGKADAEEDAKASTLANLLHFGRFWLIYYEQRERDKLSLELGSTFKHAEWVELINELLAPHTHPRSLRRYMKPSDRARYFQGDVSPSGEKLSLFNAKPSSSDMHEVRMFRTS